MQGQIPPRPPAAGDVALSITELGDVALAPALALLGKEELARAERITFAAYRLQVAKARALLRVMLARFTGEPARSFAFDEGGGTRPRLRVNPWSLHLSVSHSGDQVAIAIAPTAVGIDIEHTGADCSWQPIADVCFHQSERARLQGLDEAAAREAFFEIWTRKEAYLKGIGTGLDTDPASFSTVAPDRVVVTDTTDLGVGAWHTEPIDAPDRYKAALASRLSRPHLVRCQLDELTPADRLSRGVARDQRILGARPDRRRAA